MTVYPSKLIFSIFIFISFSFSLVYSFDLCGVSFNSPYFSVNDSSGNDLLLIDSSGNVFIQGEDHTSPFPFNHEKVFTLGNLGFSSTQSSFNPSNFHPNSATLPTTNSLLIKDSSGSVVASLGSDGNIYAKGKGAFEGSQSNCLSDGNYCSGSYLENRDYFCDLTGIKSGSCSYNVKSSENCLTKQSVDSDGSNYFNRGLVKDYTGCSGSSCTFSAYTDYCSGDRLNEYLSTGIGVRSISKNCNDYEYNYCVGNDEVWKTNWGCSSGGCSQSSSSLVMSCPVSSTTYTSWACVNDFTRKRTITRYSPTCSGSSCGQTSSSSSQYESAPSGYYCSGGNWALIKNCGGYWDYTYGSCSVSCGGGNYDKKWITTTYPTPGGTACPSPSFYDNGGNSCNTQSCTFLAIYKGERLICYSSDSVKSLIISYYKKYIYRCPEVSGLDYWYKQYYKNTWTSYELSQAIYNSASIIISPFTYSNIVAWDNNNLCGGKKYILRTRNCNY